jgi:hypothetical protein
LAVFTAFSLLVVAVFLFVGVLSCRRLCGRLRALWREPALRVPVLIFESDDWGAGPVEQAQCLRRLRGVLGAYQDAQGRHPVMTLGITLAAPLVKEKADGSFEYQRRFLDEPLQQPMLDEIRAGICEGVFSAQLHGMEHFMPELLCDVAGYDASLKKWLLDGEQYSELLPARLQSRWIDARQLPSSEHADALVDAAVAAEVREFTRIFDVVPEVVVPPTFVWTRRVEAAWARHGVRLLVSCGTRFIARDAEGRPVSDGSRMHNGDVSGGLLCVVRDAYFEPQKGHRGENVPDTLARYAALGRPLLLETHRSNFTALNLAVEQAFVELEQAIRLALARFPTLHFLSTAELGEAIRKRDPALLDHSFSGRFRIWIRRVAQQSAWLGRALFSRAGG